MSNTWTPIGELCIDSASFAIVDSMHTALRASDISEGSHYEILVEGVVGYTPDGDGVYQIYADLSANGHIQRIMVDFREEGRR